MTNKIRIEVDGAVVDVPLDRAQSLAADLSEAYRMNLRSHLREKGEGSEAPEASDDRLQAEHIAHKSADILSYTSEVRAHALQASELAGKAEFSARVAAYTSACASCVTIGMILLLIVGVL